jgi:hypothetical protein
MCALGVGLLTLIVGHERHGVRFGVQRVGAKWKCVSSRGHCVGGTRTAWGRTRTACGALAARGGRSHRACARRRTRVRGSRQGVGAGASWVGVSATPRGPRRAVGASAKGGACGTARVPWALGVGWVRGLRRGVGARAQAVGHATRRVLTIEAGRGAPLAARAGSRSRRGSRASRAWGPMRRACASTRARKKCPLARRSTKCSCACRRGGRLSQRDARQNGPALDLLSLTAS